MAADPGKSDRHMQNLLTRARARLTAVLETLPDRWLVVDVMRQRLVLVQDGNPVGYWPVSTAAVGLGAREGSGGTPAGVHRIGERIGLGRPPGTEFKSRVPTGRILSLKGPVPETEKDLILTRILTLEGCESGINRGPGLDSRQRYIYLHGTNREDQIGSAASGGCIRLANLDIMEVCDLVREGDPVVII